MTLIVQYRRKVDVLTQCESKSGSASMEHCRVGWVNLYQKFEIEKYSVCGKLILPKKWKGIFLNFFWHNWLANLHGFANICKLPVSNTFKDMQSKM